MVEVLSQRCIKPRRLRPYLLYTLPAPTCKCGELLVYSPDRREGSFSETRIHTPASPIAVMGVPLNILCVRAHKLDNTLQTRIAPVRYPAHEGSEGGHEG